MRTSLFTHELVWAIISINHSMLLRTRLTLMFTLITGFILLICSISVYFFTARYRAIEFEERLSKKIDATARLYADIEEVDARLLRIIQQQELGTIPNEQILIYNLDREEVYSSTENTFFQPDSGFIEEVTKNRNYFGKHGIYEMLGKVYEGKGGTFIVIAGGHDKFGLSKLRNLKNVLIVVTLGGILIFLLSGWFFTLRALKPVSVIVSKAEQMSPEKLHERLDEGNGKDELGRMAKAFNQLFERIDEAFKLQKTFVANASHELRTPLTIITGQLELLLLKPDNEGNMKASVESVLEDMKRLNRITNALLLLAQTEHNSREMTISAVQLDDVLWQVINELKNSRPDVRFHVNFETAPQSEADFCAEGNVLLFRTVILNICDNASKFSSDGQVFVILDYNEDYVRFVCTNHGKTIPSSEVKFLFQPFFRSSNSSGVRGHGLGLAMADKIMKLHQGNIRVESLSDTTTFAVEFRHKLVD